MTNDEKLSVDALTANDEGTGHMSGDSGWASIIHGLIRGDGAANDVLGTSSAA